MQKVFGDPEVEKRIVQAIEENKQPVDTEWIAHKIGVGWGTASRILLNMCLENKLTALKTTKSFVFMLPSTITPKEGA